MMTHVEKFTLNEDTDCEYCGYPMFKNDTATWFEGSVAGVYCSTACGHDDEKHNDKVVARRLVMYSSL